MRRRSAAVNLLACLLLGSLLAGGTLASGKSAAAGPVPSSLSVGFDPRIELLGVVQYLAGFHKASPPLPAEFSDVERRFAAFRRHPAVIDYAARSKDDAYGLISLFLTDPPELKWREDHLKLSPDFIRNAGGFAALERFLAELRDFAAASDFMEYYRGHGGDYARYARSARRELGDRDYMGILEKYAGTRLDSHARFVFSLLYSPGALNCFIVPYPYQGPGRRVKGPFEVNTLLGPQEGPGGVSYKSATRSTMWNELLYLILEPAHDKFEKEIGGYSGLYAPVAGECIPTWQNCSKHIFMTAIAARLDKKAFGLDARWKNSRLGEYERRISSRLEEYESHRDIYPTLQDFYPRLIDGLRAIAASTAAFDSPGAAEEDGLAGTGSLHSTLAMGFDPRIELLGTVQYLAGFHNAKAPMPEVFAEVERRFGRFRRHPAVKSYAAALARLAGPEDETYGIISLFLTDPPGLRWKYDQSRIPPDFVKRAGGPQALERFLTQLRDFAASSRFMDYYQGRRKDYARYEKNAREELQKRDYMGILEAYAGRPLASRHGFTMSLLYSPGPYSFIFPYPYQGPGVKVQGPFKILTLIGPSGGGDDLGFAAEAQRRMWDEILYVIVEPAHDKFQGEIAKHGGLYKAVAGECVPSWQNCSKYIFLTAIADRLNRRIFGSASVFPKTRLGDYQRKISSRLAEYEGHRDRYGSLEDFYPRLIDGFRELEREARR